MTARARNAAACRGKPRPLLTLPEGLRTLAALVKNRQILPRRLQVKGNETDISAQQNQARPHARFSRPHGYQGRPPHSQASAREGPRQADALRPTRGHVPVPLTGNREIPPAREERRFRKANRLLNAADFTRVFQAPKRSRDQWFSVLCRRNGRGVARLGLAISKKHCRQAVSRNRVRRIVRESFRCHQLELAGLDLIVMGQPRVATGSNEELFDSLSQHWQRCSRMAARRDRTERHDG